MDSLGGQTYLKSIKIYLLFLSEIAQEHIKQLFKAGKRCFYFSLKNTLYWM